MIADFLARLGIPPTVARAVIVAVFTAVTALLTAYAPGAPWLPAVTGLLAALAAIVDPNAGHGGAVG